MFSRFAVLLSVGPFAIDLQRARRAFGGGDPWNLLLDPEFWMNCGQVLWLPDLVPVIGPACGEPDAGREGRSRQLKGHP